MLVLEIDGAGGNDVAVALGVNLKLIAGVVELKRPTLELLVIELVFSGYFSSISLNCLI